MGKNISNTETSKPNTKLKDAREKRGWTQGELAELVDIRDSKTISRWERGIIFPSLRNRRALAKVFNMSMDELGLEKSVQHEAQVSHLPAKNTSAGRPFYKMLLPATPFIGREGEVARICALLKQPDVRLVTLMGAGGIGKTRLSVQVAKQMYEYFSGEVCFVALDSIHDQDMVIATIAKALGIHDNGKLTLPELVKQFLHAKNLLMLLDSFEHVIAAVPLLDEILQECSQVKILVTSRARLHLQAEYTFPVSPLQPEPTQLRESKALIHCAPVELFARRAQAVQTCGTRHTGYSACPATKPSTIRITRSA